MTLRAAKTFEVGTSYSEELLPAVTVDLSIAASPDFVGSIILQRKAEDGVWGDLMTWGWSAEATCQISGSRHSVRLKGVVAVGSARVVLWGGRAESTGVALDGLDHVETFYLNASAASLNATIVKAAPATLYQVFGQNDSVSDRWLKFYDKASTPVPGTDTPRLRIPLLAGSGFDFAFAKPVDFQSGLTFAMTTDDADGDTGAVSADDIRSLNALYR